MKCSEIQTLLSAYYDSELTVEVRTNVDDHVEECTACIAELTRFKDLGSMTDGLEQPETPASVWATIDQGLGPVNRDGAADAEYAQQELRPPGLSPGQSPGQSAQRELRPPKARSWKKHSLQFAAAIAATVVIGVFSWSLSRGDSEHVKMVKAMDEVATNINSNHASTLLLSKFGGSEVSYQDAISQVGFRPVASRGLPDGYTVDSIQVLDMPCCKCTQTACRRHDNSCFFIYEHDNEEPGWFAHRKRRQCECDGKTFTIVELDSQLVATWQEGSRHVTLLGARDEAEIELLLRQFEKNL